jgi:hypothetical protein
MPSVVISDRFGDTNEYMPTNLWLTCFEDPVVQYLLLVPRRLSQLGYCILDRWPIARLRNLRQRLIRYPTLRLYRNMLPSRSLQKENRVF